MRNPYAHHLPPLYSPLCFALLNLQGARTLFTGLFQTLSDMSDLAAPLVDVSEDKKMVFIVWRCPASGMGDAADTFLFGDNNKILRQNVAFRTN